MNEETTTPELFEMLEKIAKELKHRKEIYCIAFVNNKVQKNFTCDFHGPKSIANFIVEQLNTIPND